MTYICCNCKEWFIAMARYDLREIGDLDTLASHLEGHLLIIGLTKQSNHKFRPSGWAEMQAGHLSKHCSGRSGASGYRRVSRYASLLTPINHCSMNGKDCSALQIHRDIKKDNIETLVSLLGFAKDNDLTVQLSESDENRASLESFVPLEDWLETHPLDNFRQRP